MSNNEDEIEKKIIELEELLNSIDKDTNSYDYAKIQMLLGNNYNYLSKKKNKENNLEKAIYLYNKSLEIINKKDYPYEYSMTQINLGVTYNSLSTIKEKKTNLEKSISLYNESLEIINKKDHPYKYIDVKINLALSYSLLSQISKVHADIENAICSHNEVLEIFNKDSYPYEYAMTQIDIATLYVLLSKKKDKESNFENAIYSYNKALEILNKKDYPHEYAIIQINLGVYYNSIQKIRDKESNLEKAINSYNQALEILNKKDYPYKYAMTQMNLGIFYWEFSKIKTKEINLEKAINSYDQALEILNKKDYPYDYAMIQMNLGISYNSLSEIKDEESNLEKAIYLQNKALEIRNKKDYPYQYSITQMNIGATYSSLSKIRDKESNLEKAINSYDQALEILNKKDYPYDYAMTQMNLGLSYSLLSEIIDKENNFKKAICSYNEALEIRTKKDYPYQYSLTQMNLGLSYSSLSKFQNEENNLEKSILSFQESIKYSPDGNEKILCYLNYSYTLILNKKYIDSYYVLKEAIEGLEKRRINLIDPKSKEYLLTSSKKIYLNMIKVCSILMIENINNSNEYNKYQLSLFKYIEMSKTRSLIDIINSKNRIIFDKSLANDDLILKQKIELLNELEHDIANIEKLENDLSSGFSGTRGISITQEQSENDTKKLKEIEKIRAEKQEQKDELLEELYKYPHIKARLSQINGNVISIDELRGMIGNQISDNTAIIQYYLSENFYLINVITNDKTNTIFQDDIEEVSKLNYWLELYNDCFELFGRVKDSSYFKNKAEEIKEKYSELNIQSLNNFEFNNYILDLLGKQLYKYLVEPVEEFIKDKKRLMFISESKLHNLSFNILQKNNKFLIDDLDLYKLPSASLWASLKEKMNQDFDNINIFAVSEYYKCKSLENVPKEVNNIINSFESKYVNLYIDDKVKPISIKDKMKESSILSLIGHGYSENKDSGYLYIDNIQKEDLKLSISTIFSSFPSFEKNQLVMLSICHGGKQLFIGQEIIGMNSVLLMLGAGAIISNLIELSDEIGEKFSRIFYEKLSNKLIYEKGLEDKLDIFCQSIKELKSTRESKIEEWAFLEFQGNPSF